MKKKQSLSNIVLTVFLTVLSVVWVYPVIMILFNSLKLENAISTNTAFQLPAAETFAGLQNYAIFTKLVYFLFVFSMVVPFQMLMFTLAATSDQLKLNTPWNIWVIYLGFGAGLAVFMFAGFMKSIPLEIEEAAMIDGCNPVQTFFMIVLPVLKPTMISVGILETMWVWNDYLLPYLVLDRKKYTTVPILIQYFKGSFGRVEMGPMMACIMLTVLPIIVVYLICQKHIIKGVVAGAVKG